MTTIRKCLLLGTIGAGLVLLLAIPACWYEVEDPITPAPPDAVQPEGSCMCTTCWNQPFCWDPTLPKGDEFYGTPPCNDPSHEAIEGKRVVDAVDGKEDGFWCVKPFDGANVAYPDKECPLDEDERFKVENRDPCVDLPDCATPADKCGGSPPSPTCPEVSQNARVTECVAVPNYDPQEPEETETNGAIAGVDKMIEYCAKGATEPPSGSEPDRYCFLACVAADTCLLDSDQVCVGCSGVDGGEGGSGGAGGGSSAQSWSSEGRGTGDAFPVDFESTNSLLTVLMKDEHEVFQTIDSIAVSGRVHFRVPEDCWGPNVEDSCQASMTRMNLASVGTLSLLGTDVSNVRLINMRTVEHTFVTRDDDGDFSIPAPVQFGLTGDVDADEYLYADFATTSTIETAWDWTCRCVTLGVTLVSEDGNLKVEFEGLGTFDSLPPTSVASASATTIHRGSSTTLSAASSTDRDNDIQAVTWTSNWDGFIWQGSGTTQVVTPPVGSHRFYAQVVDSAACTDTSYVDVTVTDP